MSKIPSSLNTNDITLVPKVVPVALTTGCHNVAFSGLQVAAASLKSCISTVEAEACARCVASAKIFATLHSGEGI